MKTIFGIIFILMALNITKSQVSQEWIAEYAAENNTPIRNAIDCNGNLIVAGYSKTTNYDFVVFKYSPAGHLIWSKRYDGPGNSHDYLRAMVIDDSGNVYVCGASYGGVATRYDWATIKYAAKDGKEMWVRRFDWRSNSDEPFGMCLDIDKNVYVVGFGPINNLTKEMITAKYSPNGDSIWTIPYRFNTLLSDWGYSICVDSSLNVYSLGYTWREGIMVGNAITIIKYDKDGTVLWIRNHPTNDGDFLRPIFSKLDAENNLVVVGNFWDYSFVTIKYSTEGRFLWGKRFGGGGTDRANSLFVDDNCNIMITGSHNSSTASDYLILKYSPEGDSLLCKYINGIKDQSLMDIANDALMDRFGNIYVTGFSENTSFRTDFLTAKLSPSGSIIWQLRYKDPPAPLPWLNLAYCISLDSSYNVYVSGYANGISTSLLTTIKYSQLTGASNVIEPVVPDMQLYNFPNPFNPVTIISYAIPKSAHVKITVYNSLGTKVRELVNEFLSAGDHEIQFDGKELPSGVYFCVLESSSRMLTRRILLVK
jgi:hypothetical protein